LELIKGQIDRYPSEIAAFYNDIGAIYDILFDYNKGIQYKLEGLQIYKQHFGELHSSTATCYNNVGVSYEKMQDLTRSLEFKSQSLEIFL
jgi:hypothetical protein